MHAKTPFAASFALAILLAGCNSTPPDTREADANAIRQLESDWSKAFATKDAGKVSAFYADDASLFIAGRPLVTGKANIADVWRQYLADSNFSLTFSSDKVGVSKSGDLGSSEGSYTMTYSDPTTNQAVMEKGKYVEVYVKQAGGSWKDVADIGNADGPPTPVKR